jgi:lysophospholipase L1-like esterase
MPKHSTSALVVLTLVLWTSVPTSEHAAQSEPLAANPGRGYDAVAMSDDLDLPRVARRLGSGRPVRIVAFGSSSTEGIGATSPTASYPARLEAELNHALSNKAGVSVSNRGIGGEHAEDMLARLDRDVLAARPDLVIWQTGSNDPLRGVPLSRFSEMTRVGLERMRAAGIDVMLMDPQWCSALDAVPGADLYREAIRAIGAEFGVPVIRRAEMMHRWVADKRLPRGELMSPDGLHMTDRSYALLAAEVAKDILIRAAKARTDSTTASSSALAARL